MAEVTIKEVIRTLRKTDDQYYEEVNSLKESIDWDLSFLSFAILENNQEDISRYKRSINKARQKLMEMEYYPLVNK